MILSGKASVIVQPEFNPTQVAVSGPGYTLEGPSTVLLSDETAAFSFQVAGALTEDEPAAVRRLERLPDGSASDLIAEGQRRWAKLLGTLESPEVKDHQNVLYRAVIILMKNIVSRADSNGLGVPVPNRSSDLEVQLPAAALSIAALAELDADAAEGAVRALLSEDPEDAVRLQSPALAWAARQVYERKMTPRDGKPSSAVQRKAEKFLREIYPSLTAWNGAWRTVYDEDGDGLVSRDGVVEADLNAHLLMDMKTLAWMARALGKEAEAAQWEQRAETLGRMMLYNLYDVQSHTFRNMDADSREFVGAQERPSLLPLLAGVPLPAEAVWATTEEQFLGESSLDVLDPARAYFSLILLSSVSGLMAHKGWHDRAERLNQKINESRGSLLAYYDLNGLQGRSGTEIVQDFSPAAAAALLAGLKRQADQGVWTPEEHRELSPIPPAPEPAYAGVYVNNDRVHLRLIRDSVIKSAEVFLPPEGEGDIASLVLQMLREMLEEMESQTGVPGYLASAGIAANPLGRNRQPRRDMAAGIGSRLWLEWDVPWWRSRVRGFSHAAVTTRAAAESLQWHRAGPLDVVDVVPDDDTGEMRPSELASFEEYRRLTIERGYATPEIWNDIEREARAFKGKKAVFLNSTAQGGGVALMRHAIIRLYRQLGVDAHWFVLEGNPQVFEITKNKMHNVFQAIPGYGGELTDMDREILADFARHNFERMKWVLADADVIVKDDYQGVEMLPMIRAVNPQAKILYRSHIQIQARLIDAAEETPQKTLWAYVLDKLQKAEIDLFISHPLPEFVPGLREDADGAYMELPSSFGASRVPVDFMGATTDPLDGLNKPLTDEQRQFHMERFNEVLQRAGQEPLDLARPWFIQVARFDPAKGIPELIEAYSRFRRRLEEAKAAGTISAETPVPQLVIMGHGAVDDPEGQPLYDKAREQIRSLPLEIARDIKVARVAHNDQVLNAALRGATAALQLSIAEGFEVKVSEAKDKGVPVIAYETGGIPKQIHDGESGHLVPVGEVNSSSDRTRRMDQVAGLLYQYATDDGFRERMQAGAARDRRPDAWTPMNALRWLRHFNRAPRRMSAEVAGEQLTLFNMAPGLSLLALTPAGAAPGIAAAAAFGLGLLTFALLFKWGMLVSRRRAAAHVGVRQSPGVRRQEDRAGIVRALGEEILKDVVLDGRARPVQWSLPNGQTVGVEGLLAEDRLGGERLHRRLGELLNGTDPDEAKGLVAAGLQKALVQHSGVDVSGIGAEMGENPISLVAAPRDLRALLPRLLGVQTSGRLLVLVESLREAEQEARILGLKRHNGDWLSENGVIVRFEAAGPALKGDRFRLAEADPRLRIFAGSTPYTSVNVFVADHLTVDDSGLAGDSPLRRAVIIFINSLLQALPLRFEDLPHLDKAARYLAQQA
ncbi:MAG: MGH1-like glycoside hydrolase domain-containing protein [Elusimicrobiota bacterium]